MAVRHCLLPRTLTAIIWADYSTQRSAATALVIKVESLASWIYRLSLHPHPITLQILYAHFLPCRLPMVLNLTFLRAQTVRARETQSQTSMVFHFIRNCITWGGRHTISTKLTETWSF
ncbi:hypothetical protein BDY19DRAFT_388846 [Irpex rosettiformis]|uniref:Uncharacterized protein n=1 Tax=Irpex rosettiformis TaxID=378272 RepID=A0ACB8TVH9_9APHY|nr:hypothetical protein BDY19DRAFT_388846 [Irpex rosettiformis]